MPPVLARLEHLVHMVAAVRPEQLLAHLVAVEAVVAVRVAGRPVLRPRQFGPSPGGVRVGGALAAPLAGVTELTKLMELMISRTLMALTRTIRMDRTELTTATTLTTLTAMTALLRP